MKNITIYRMLGTAGVTAAALLLTACAGGAGAAELEQAQANLGQAQSTLAELQTALADLAGTGVAAEEESIPDSAAESVVAEPREGFIVLGTDDFSITEIPLLTIFDTPAPPMPWLEGRGAQPFEREPETLDLTEWTVQRHVLLDSGVFFVNSAGEHDPVNGVPVSARRVNCSPDGEIPETELEWARVHPLFTDELFFGPVVPSERSDTGYVCYLYQPWNFHRDDDEIMSTAGQIRNGTIEVQMYTATPVLITGAEVDVRHDQHRLVVQLASDSQGLSGQFAFSIALADQELFAQINSVSFQDQTGDIEPTPYGFGLIHWSTGEPLSAMENFHWVPRNNDVELNAFLDQFRHVSPTGWAGIG